MKIQHTSTPIPWGLASNFDKKDILSPLVVGVLSLQGDFLEHIQMLSYIGIQSKEIRLREDLDGIDAIILPGGESTSMINLIDRYNLREPLTKRIENGMPTWGTCAGMILLAKKLLQSKPIPLGVMDIEVSRNAFGRQIDSFEAELMIKPFSPKSLRATFIRAPLITHVGPSVEILASLDDGTIVAAKEGNMVGTAFHPELTGDMRFHKYLVSLVNR